MFESGRVLIHRHLATGYFWGREQLKQHALMARPSRIKWLIHMAVCQNLVPLVNIKIAGKWMFIPLKMVLIGIDPYPYFHHQLHHGSEMFWAYPPVRQRMAARSEVALTEPQKNWINCITSLYARWNLPCLASRVDKWTREEMFSVWRIPPQNWV